MVPPLQESSSRSVEDWPLGSLSSHIKTPHPLTEAASHTVFWLVTPLVMRGTGTYDSVQEKNEGGRRREEGRRRGDISIGSIEAFSIQHSFQRGN